jgi:hypothetical protein
MNGQTQIKIDGQTIGLKFGYNAVKWHTIDCEQYFDEYYQKDANGEVLGLTILGLANLVYSAYKNYQLLKRQPATIEMETFYDWLFQQNQTEEGQQQISEISRVYEESREVRMFIEKMKEQTEEIKKKTQQPISSELKSHYTATE